MDQVRILAPLVKTQTPLLLLDPTFRVQITALLRRYSRKPINLPIRQRVLWRASPDPTISNELEEIRWIPPPTTPRPLKSTLVHRGSRPRDLRNRPPHSRGEVVQYTQSMLAEILLMSETTPAHLPRLVVATHLQETVDSMIGENPHRAICLRLRFPARSLPPTSFGKPQR